MWEAVWKWFGRWLVSGPEVVGGHIPSDRITAPQPLHKEAAQGIDGGCDNVQVGAACGDVNVNSHRHTQAVYHIYHMAEQKAPPEVPQASRPSFTPQPTKADASMPSSVEQSATLRRLEQVPSKRIAILNFMEREFGTRMVINLKPEQLYRLNRYLDAVLKSTKDAPRKRPSQAASKKKNVLKNQ